MVHLKFISELYNKLKDESDILIQRYTELSKKIYKFIDYVDKERKT